MNETQTMTIGEVCATISDTYRAKADEVTLINTSDVLEGKVLNHERVPNKELKGQFKKTFKKNDILYSEIRPQNKRFAFVDFDPVDYIASTKLMVLRADTSKVLPMYLYYYLKSAPVIAELQMLAETRSGTFPQITFTELSNLTIPVPSITEQEAIVATIKCIEDKIDCNTKINDNLLQQAQSVFTDWFVRFTPFASDELVASPIEMEIPKSLSMIQIGDVPHILETGRRPKGGAADSGIPSVGAENVKQLGKFDFSSKKFIPEDFAAKQKTGRIKGYELLLYKDGGKPGTFIPHFSMFGEGFPYTDFFINEHVFKLDFFDRGKNIFAYFYMQTDYATSWLANNGGKAAIPGINQQDVRAIWIYDMDHPQVQQFCRWVEPLFKTIFCNCYENMRLADLRDTLLPKLISGTIDVSSVKL